MAATLDVPQYNRSFHAGDIVKLDKFSSIEWMIGYGWYNTTIAGPVCGWYLMRCDLPGEIKPFTTEYMYTIEVVRCAHEE